MTRQIKVVASGESKFNGFALRIVPDRGIDEGWTVRCDIAPNATLYLELDLYAD